MRFVFVVLLVAAVDSSAQTTVQDSGSSEIPSYLPCMKITDGFIGQRANEPFLYRAHSGGIPHTNEDRIRLPQVTVVFYSKNRRRAVLLQSILSGSFVLVFDGTIELKHRSRGWEVVYSSFSGGFDERAQAFVSSLDSLPMVVKVIPSSNLAYCIEERQWNVPDSKYLPYQK